MSNGAATAETSVLLVTYYFPPSGGPGVQRVLKFARYLPEHGFRPIVLTVPETAAFPMRDPSLLAEIPPEAVVLRSPIREFYALARRASGEEDPGNLATGVRPAAGWRGRLLQWARGAFFVPDGRVGWLAGGTRSGLDACRREPIRLVFASGPPFTAHWIARRISQRRGLPLVLDFRDPWTRAPFYPARSWIPRRLDEGLERSCLRQASAILTVNRAIRDDFLSRYRDLSPERFHWVPNGWDPADFPTTPRTPPEDWVLTHTGTLPTVRFPAGFVAGLRRLLEEDAEAARRLRIRLIGRITPELATELTRPPLDNVVQIEPYRPHAESVRALIESRLLLFFIEEGPQAHGTLTGKLFEYLGSGVPILALVPEGEAAELIRQVRGGRVVAGDDPVAAAAALREAVDAFRSGRRPFGQPDRERIADYTRPALTARLAEIFRQVLEADPSGSHGSARRA